MPHSHLRPDFQAIANAIPKKSRVLDLGCGEGELLEYLVQEKQVDGRGIELSQEGVSVCVQKGLFVIQGDAETDLIYYPDDAFDYVVSSFMLQATRNPKEVLGHIMRIAKRSVVTIPNFGHWKNRLYLLLKGEMPVTSALSYQWYETPNIHFCTIRDFDHLCDELGYGVERKIYLGRAHKKLSPFKASFANLTSESAIYVLK